MFGFGSEENPNAGINWKGMALFLFAGAALVGAVGYAITRPGMDFFRGREVVAEPLPSKPAETGSGDEEGVSDTEASETQD